MLSLVRNAMKRAASKSPPPRLGRLIFAAKLTPADLAGLIQRAEAAVTNDSGSMHVAASLNKPMVSVFGPTNPVHIGPVLEGRNRLCASTCRVRPAITGA